MEILENIRVNRETNREILKSKEGSIFWLDTIMPSNFLKKTRYVLVIDYIIKDNDKNRKKIKEYLGYIETEIICANEGFGHIVFNSEGYEILINKAENFMRLEKAYLDI